MTDLYRFYDADNRLLYVGISLHAATRASQHRGDKGWWTDVVQMTVERHATRELALAAELQAIRTQHPIHNVAGAIPGEPAIVTRALDEPQGLVGQFVITNRDHHRFPGHQGIVVARVSDYHYQVQWMSWWNGEWTNSSVVAVDHMDGWKFYNTHDAFLEAGDKHMRETDRILDRAGT